MKEFGLIIKLGVAIVLIMVFGDFVPEWIQRSFFTISLIIKEVLIFCMPFIVFSFIFSSLTSFQKKAPLLILIILMAINLSNFIFVQLGYWSGEIFLPYLGYHALEGMQDEGATLEPFFTAPYSFMIRLDIALLLGTVAGLYGAFMGHEKLALWGERLKNKVQQGLVRIFIPLVPLYVIGFLFKIQYEDSLFEMFAGYGPMIGLIVLVQLFSTLLFYVKANFGRFQSVKNSLRNTLPSGLVAFSTMSSMATLPLTLEAAEKNTKSKELAQLVVPTTTNIHHVGDSVAIPILIAVVLATYGFEPMSYSAFLLFSTYFMVAKYGVASVPGGEAIVILPILENYFGFTDTMVGLLTTLYILMDPFITTANVMCNGALAICMDKICGKIKAFHAITETSH